MARNIETNLNEFFQNNKAFLVHSIEGEESDSILDYLWDDYPKVKEKLKSISQEESNLHCYTLVEEDGKAYILSNWHFINRIGYFVSTKKVEPNISIRYW